MPISKLDKKILVIQKAITDLQNMGYKITISKYIGTMTGRMVDQINVEGMSGDKLVWQHLLSITQND